MGFTLRQEWGEIKARVGANGGVRDEGWKIVRGGDRVSGWVRNRGR